jgi:hypothetical protein
MGACSLSEYPTADMSPNRSATSMASSSPPTPVSPSGSWVGVEIEARVPILKLAAIGATAPVCSREVSSSDGAGEEAGIQ